MLDCTKVLPNPTSSRVKTCNSSSHSHSVNLISKFVKPAYVGVTKNVKKKTLEYFKWSILAENVINALPYP